MSVQPYMPRGHQARLKRRRVLAALPLAIIPSSFMLAVAEPRRVFYEVPLIPQETAMSCWAAAIAMIVSWAEQKPISPLDVARKSKRLVEYQNGLDSLDAEVFNRWGMTTEAPQTFTAEGFMDLLITYGPIWVAAEVRAPHIRVATGFDYDSDPDTGRVHINDPWEQDMTTFRPENKGSRYTETYVEFVRKNETLGSEELSIQSDTAYPVYFAHLTQKPDHL